MSVPRVLVVEDDEDLREALYASLLDASFEPFEAHRVDRARDIIMRAPPDAMLIDGLLPDGSGADLVKFARERGFGGAIVLMSTFDGFARDVEDLVDGFVDKKHNSPVAIVEALAREHRRVVAGDARS